MEQNLIFINFFIRCWLNLSNAVSTVFIAPNCLLFGLTVVFLLISIFGSAKETFLSDANSNRKM